MKLAVWRDDRLALCPCRVRSDRTETGLIEELDALVQIEDGRPLTGESQRPKRHPETQLPWYGAPNPRRWGGRSWNDPHSTTGLRSAPGDGYEYGRRSGLGNRPLPIKLPAVVDCRACGESVRVDRLTYGGGAS